MLMKFENEIDNIRNFKTKMIISLNLEYINKNFNQFFQLKKNVGVLIEPLLIVLIF